MDGKYDALALVERDDFDPRLHAGPLFGENEFASGEINAGSCE